MAAAITFFLSVIVLVAYVCYSSGIIINASMANKLSDNITLSSSTLSPSAVWIQQPIKFIDVRTTVSAAVSQSLEKDGSDSGNLVFGMHQFPPLAITFSWHYPAGGTPVYNVTAKPSPFIGGIEGIDTKGDTVTIRGYVTKMCLDGEKNPYCVAA